MTDPIPKQRRGFAAMTPEKRREIASKGGRSVDPAKRTFSVSREHAQRCGRTGGLRAHGKEVSDEKA